MLVVVPQVQLAVEVLVVVSDRIGVTRQDTRTTSSVVGTISLSIFLVQNVIGYIGKFIVLE